MYDIFLVSESASLKEALNKINENKQGFVITVDESGMVVGLVTDGDIRRALLDGYSIDDKITKYINYKPKKIYKGFTNNQLKNLLVKYKITSLPVLNNNNQIIDLISWNDLTNNQNKWRSALRYLERTD